MLMPKAPRLSSHDLPYIVSEMAGLLLFIRVLRRHYLITTDQQLLEKSGFPSLKRRLLMMLSLSQLPTKIVMRFHWKLDLF